MLMVLYAVLTGGFFMDNFVVFKDKASIKKKLLVEY